MVSQISRQELQAKLARGERVVLVEALPAKYYRHAHLPGALNIPHDEVDALAPSLLPDKAAEIVVYCANAPCRNSGIAAARLAELGYASVRDYHEGKQDWIDAGLPTVKGNEPFAAAAE
jgi:rhodanese-related sulfurtransferase